MLSKNKIKFIKSLKNKKYRDNSGIFVAEGSSLAYDLLSFYPELLSEGFVSKKWLDTYPTIERFSKLVIAEKEQLHKASLFNSPSEALFLFTKPTYAQPTNLQNISLFIDSVQDPGNMGTIFRTAAWYGVQALFYNDACADPYGHKTVRASMGAVLQVPHFKMEISEWRTHYPQQHLLGALLNGNNIESVDRQQAITIAVGSEGQGLQDAVIEQLNSAITIPKKGNAPIESLNVGIATAILLHALS